MKGMITVKKILKIIGIIATIFVIAVLYISYIIDHNSQELSQLAKEIKNHYKTTEEITYSNEYNNYYIIKTTNQAIVLTKEYKEVKKEDLSKLKGNFQDANLIYKTNKLMYEKVVVKNNKTIYEYYDALTGEHIKKTVLELQ